MNFTPATMDIKLSEVPQNHYVVIHPLNDLPEEKVDTSQLGPMPMTTGVKLSLIALRSYLILMSGLVLYHVMDIAGLFKQYG